MPPPAPTANVPLPTREDIVLDYLGLLKYPPYPVQEEALFAWAACEDGVLLSAPTGTGKTLVAELCVYEALRLGTQCYYSTPLIALTDQKFLELQDTVERWGFPRESVGLVTGHRTVNPEAPIKVVVAEVLLNRLLHPEAFDFGPPPSSAQSSGGGGGSAVVSPGGVGSVVMDEFHNFNEPRRGIVWELSLALLPKQVRVMLLSATVGAAHEFVTWMYRSSNRAVTLVEGKDRRVPLHFQWVGDELLPDFLEKVAKGTESLRRTPALVFCFDRSICWDTAEVLKGRDLFAEGQRQPLLDRLESFDFSVGAGNKLRTFLARGVGIHHAGLLPRYRRVVETLFQEKLLPICVCTETLAAGLNLPARSVVLTTLVKGPRDKKKLIDPSSAQQMFGRAGRPQFDTEGHVYAMSHEDDVKLARWQEKYDSIHETEKDPKLMSAKKALLKKKPTRRAGFTYWNPEQFTKLQTAPPARLASKGRLNWRWLGYLLEARAGDVEPIRDVLRLRLMDPPSIEAEVKRLARMLVTLHQLDVVTLTPPPPQSWLKPAHTITLTPLTPTPADDDEGDDAPAPPATTSTSDIRHPTSDIPAPPPTSDISHTALLSKLTLGDASLTSTPKSSPTPKTPVSTAPALTEPYEPVTAAPRPKLKQLMVFKAVHPLFGLFLMNHLGQADDTELLQILESMLEMPGSVAKLLRVPKPEDLPPGKFTLETVDPALLQRGIASHDDLYPPPVSEQSDLPPELRKYPIPLADKVRLMFESEVDHAGGLFITPVWAAGDFLARGGTFDAYIRTRELIKQEGILFKHFLRLVLLCSEFADLTPTGTDDRDWRAKMRAIADTLTTACREVDPQCTDEMLEELADP